jgi:pimeloyl-ACP methyl ester carboxylesterase
MLSLVGDVRAVVEDLGLDDPAIVGHSLGVTVAAIYAAAHGARAVVCVDSTLRFGDFASLARPYAAELRAER